MDRLPAFLHEDEAEDAVSAVLNPGIVVLEKLILEENLISVDLGELKEALEIIRNPGEIMMKQLVMTHVNFVKK